MSISSAQMLESAKQKKRDYVTILAGAVLLGFLMNVTSSMLLSYLMFDQRSYVTVGSIILTILVCYVLYRHVSDRRLQHQYDLDVFYYVGSDKFINTEIKKCGLVCDVLQANLQTIKNELQSTDTQKGLRDLALAGEILFYLAIDTFLQESDFYITERSYNLTSGGNLDFFSQSLSVPDQFIANNRFLSDDHNLKMTNPIFPKGIRLEISETKGINDGFHLIKLIHPFGEIELDNVLTYLTVGKTINPEPEFDLYLKSKNINKKELLILWGAVRVTIRLNLAKSFHKEFASFLVWGEYILNSFDSVLGWKNRDNDINQSLLVTLYRRLIETNGPALDSRENEA